MTASMSRLGALVLVALGTACSSKDEADQNAVASDSAETVITTDSDGGADVSLEKQLEKLAALTGLIVAGSNDLPRAEFEPAALAAVVGVEPQKLFEWVRDRTFWAPYRGLLRGGKGVMLDRVGSSLDRAVLLGDLLRQSGYTVRLAHAELPESQARDLLAKVRSIPARRRASVAAREIPEERKRAIAALLPDLEKESQRQFMESMRITAEAETLVRSQVDSLLTTVREASRAAPPFDDNAAINALRDHWWIELQDGNEWIAMDVLLPDAKAGETLITAARVSNWSKSEAWPEVPEADWHAVQIRVIAERYEGGVTNEATLLEALLRPAEEIEHPITLGHTFLPWPNESPDRADPASVRNAALAVRAWVPYLKVGKSFVAQSGFSVRGEVETNPLATARELSKVGGADVVGGMDMALGGFEADESVPAATAEWLDYEIRVPGAPPVRLRRPVFDLLGPARRARKASDFDGAADLRKLERVEALWSQTDILLQPCEFTEEFVAHLALSSILEEQKSLKALAKERERERVRALAADILRRASLWGPLPDLVMWRSALGGQADDWFVDRPNVLNYRISRTITDSEEIGIRQLIDVAANAGGARRAADVNPFEVRVRQGVIDTVAEMLTLNSDLGASQNTASVFGRLAAENSRGLLIGARDQDAVQALPWPEDEAARVGSDVGAGYLAVVPRKAVLIDGEPHVGWWRVHPETGATVGVMDTGFNAVDEKAELDDAIASLERHLARHADEWAEARRVEALERARFNSLWRPTWSTRQPEFPGLREREQLEALLEVLKWMRGGM